MKEERQGKDRVRRGEGEAADAEMSEHRVVSVLFVDVVGSYRLLDGLEIDAAADFLNKLLEYMCSIVERYGGTVTTRSGDGVLAVFGVPRALEAHEVQAARAALTVHEELHRLQDEIPAPRDVQFYTSIHSGEVLAQSSPHAEKLPEVLGETVFLASRLNKVGGPGVVTVTDDVARRLGDAAKLVSMGLQTLRGSSRTVEIFRVLEIDPARLEMHGARSVGFSPFVGRDAELKCIQKRLHETAEKGGGIIAVVGEAGIGKSRLLYEARAEARRLGAVVLRGGCSDFGRSLAYQPFREIIETLFDENGNVPEGIRARLHTEIELNEDCGLALKSVLGRVPEGSRWQSYDSERKHSLIQESIARVLFLLSEETPLLVEIEDLHWIDGESLELLDFLAPNVALSRVLIVLTSRRSVENRSDPPFVVEEITLRALDVTDISTIVEHRARSGVTDAETLARIEELSGGNPLFAEECARLLDAYERVPAAKRSWRDSRSLLALSDGSSIQSVIAARLDDLPREARRVLIASSAIGTRFGLDVLERIVDLSPERVLDMIDLLLRAELIFQVSPAASRSYRFKHSITCEVAYRSMTKRMCTIYHDRVLRAFEVIHGERAIEFADVLKEHAKLAGNQLAAIRYQRVSAMAALDRSANDECLALLEECLATAKELPRSREVIEIRIDLGFELRNVLEIIEPGRISAILRDSEELAASLGDDWRLGLAKSYMTHALWVEGSFDDALDQGRRAVEIGKRLGAPEIWIPALYHSALVLLGMGRHREASSRFEEVVEAAHGTRHRSRLRLNVAPSTLARSYRARCLAEMAMFDEALAEAQRAREDAYAERGHYAMAFAELALGHIEISRSAPDAAIPWLEASVAGFRASDAKVMGPVSEAFLGYAMAGTGRAGEAVPLLERAIEDSRASEVWEQLSLRTMFLSEAYLVANELDNARSTLNTARKLAIRHQEQPSIAYIDWQSVRISLAEHRCLTADDTMLLESVIARCRSMEMHALIMRCKALLDRRNYPLERHRH